MSEPRACRKCGRRYEIWLGLEQAIELDEEGLCYSCWMQEYGIFPDYRSSLQVYLDEMAGGDEEEA